MLSFIRIATVMVSLYSNRTVTKTEEREEGDLRTFHHAGKIEKKKRQRKEMISKESLMNFSQFHL